MHRNLQKHNGARDACALGRSAFVPKNKNKAIIVQGSEMCATASNENIKLEIRFSTAGVGHCRRRRRRQCVYNVHFPCFTSCGSVSMFSAPFACFSIIHFLLAFCFFFFLFFVGRLLVQLTICVCNRTCCAALLFCFVAAQCAVWFFFYIILTFARTVEVDARVHFSLMNWSLK